MADTARDIPRQAVPLPRTPLVGRERELAAAIELLPRPSVSVLTLTGPAGTGKTRLALHIAAGLQEDFAHGVCLVPFAQIRDPDLVAATIARAFGLGDDDQPPILRRLEAYLQQKDVLLLLDNCEHLVDAAPVLAELLLTCPRLKMLATSRTPLRILGEHDFPVPPLALPDPALSQSSARLMEVPSVALFVQRAREIDASFALDASNRADIAEICVRLDGLPLAIELAAARTRLLSPSALRARLTNRLALLTDGPRDQPPRLRGMRDAIAWSYDLLSDDEQALFRRLSVFVGGFSIEAIGRLAPLAAGTLHDSDRAISGPDDLEALEPATFQLISQLVEKSLVLAENDECGESRFRLLETVREFAHERLVAANEVSASREIHAETYLTLMECAEPHLHGPIQATWFGRIESEYPSLRAALSWFQEQGRVEPALRLAGALGRFWEARGHLTEGRRWLEELLRLAARSEHSVSAVILAEAENWAGTLTYWQGDFAAADALHASAAHRFKNAGDVRGEAFSLLNQGQAASFGGDLDRAISLIACSRDRFAAIEDEWGIAAAISGMANPLLDAARLDEADRVLAESLPLVRHAGDPDLLAMTLFNVGWLASLKGDDNRAESALVESLALYRQIGGQRTVPYTLNLLGLLAWRQAQFARASALLVESLTLSRDLGTQLGVVNSLETLIVPARETANHEHVACLLGATESIRSTIGAPLPPVERVRIAAASAASRAVLGEDAFATAFGKGRSLPLQETIACALEFAESLEETPEFGREVAPVSRILTRREDEILRLLVEGHSNPEIADALFISAKTVRNHVTNIFAKFGVKSRTAAATFALRNDLL